MKNQLILGGDENTPDLPMTTAQVSHLRRLLAWMRLEYMLDENMQRGYLAGASEMAALGLSSQERASELVQEKVDRVHQVPAYVRQAVKMLTKAIHDHEKAAGIVDAESSVKP